MLHKRYGMRHSPRDLNVIPALRATVYDAPNFASSRWQELDQLRYNLSRAGHRPRLEESMRTIVVLTFTLLLLTGVAFSQGRESEENANDNPNTMADKQNAAAARAAMEQQKQKQVDAQYKAALDRAKAPIAPSDPWGDVRPVKTPATSR
jgi:hypothetical protein